MATRSTIAIENEDGSVYFIYCHFDGYLENNGRILLEHYQNRDTVSELVKIGDMSCLEETLEDCVFYSERNGPCMAVNLEDYLKNFEGFQDYNYILRSDGNWYYFTNNVNDLKILTIPESN